MVRFTVPIADILGLSYYCYEITPSNYNPTIDGSITISVRVTNVFGNTIDDKQVTLYSNGSTVGTATTNNVGVATFSYTFSDWDLHRFVVGNASLELQATGLKQVAQKTNNVVKYTLYADESSRTCVIRIESTSNCNIANGEQYAVTGLIPSKYTPKANLFCDVNRNANIMFYCWTGGSGGLYNRISTTQTSQSIYGQLTYSY